MKTTREIVDLLEGSLSTLRSLVAKLSCEANTAEAINHNQINMDNVQVAIDAIYIAYSSVLAAQAYFIDAAKDQ